MKGRNDHFHQSNIFRPAFRLGFVNSTVSNYLKYRDSRFEGCRPNCRHGFRKACIRIESIYRMTQAFDTRTCGHLLQFHSSESATNLKSTSFFPRLYTTLLQHQIIELKNKNVLNIRLNVI